MHAFSKHVTDKVNKIFLPSFGKRKNIPLLFKGKFVLKAQRSKKGRGWEDVQEMLNTAVSADLKKKKKSLAIFCNLCD